MVKNKQKFTRKDIAREMVDFLYNNQLTLANFGQNTSLLLKIVEQYLTLHYENFPLTISTKDAVRQIAKDLAKDKDYYMTWKANIAMTFLDELQQSGYQFPNMNNVCNLAAERFLRLLMGDSK